MSSIIPSTTMIWLLVVCLLANGEESRKTKDSPHSFLANDEEVLHYPDSILEINKDLGKHDLHGHNLLEGDIIIARPGASSYSARNFLWPKYGEEVVIPYNISKDYEEYHRFVLFQAFKELEAKTCIRFIERTTQRDHIYIFPGIGCYSSVGCVGKMQQLSLGFECIQRGKGVVLHELLHAIGFWHEHSRKDREKFVEISWSAIDEKYLNNFCMYDTTNMIVKYDYGSLMHYSSLAFSKKGALTIKPKDSDARIGQRTKLSSSDIQRVNKLYQCPQYAPSSDDNNVVVDPDDLSSEAICPGVGIPGSGSHSSVKTLAMPLADLASLDQELSPVAPPQSEESQTGQETLHSSGPESTSVFSKEINSVANGFVHSLTTELHHVITDLTMPNGNATFESVRGTIAPEFMQYHSTVSIAHRSTEPSPTEPPKRTAAPEFTHEDNSTIQDTEHLPGDHSPAVTTISAVRSSVTNSELTLRSTTRSAPELIFNSTASLQASINPEAKGTEHSTKEAIPKIHPGPCTTVSTIREGLSTEAILPISIYMPKRTTSNVDVMESHAILQTSTSSQSGAKQEQTTTEDTWISSGSGETINASYGEDHEHVKINLPKIVRKRSLAWKTLGSWSEHHPRSIYGYKLTHLYKIRNSSLIIEPFCGFEHGLCGWKQSSSGGGLDWRLGWRNLNANVGPSGPEGFHLSLKHRPGKRVGKNALLFRPVVQPSNCISFWYGSRHSVKGTLNVYITSSGGEQTLLWSSDGQDHAQWTKAQIMLPPPLLHNHAQVVLEGVLGPSSKSNIVIDDLYVGQCS